MTSLLPKEWDSAFFGYPVAAADLIHSSTPLADAHAARLQATRAGFRLLYLFLPLLVETDRAALRQEGFRDMGGKVDYSKIIVPGAVFTPDPEIRLCQTSSAALEQLAFQSGAHSRFCRDEGFHQSEFERLYREWVGGSLAGKDGKCVYIAGPPDQPKGLLTLEPGAEIRIGLFAVAPECRRQGLGRRLICQAEQFCIARGRGELRVATQIENPEACRFYESCGFHKIHEEAIFHAWLPLPAGRSSVPGNHHE